MLPFHVTAMMVVIINELADQIIQVPLAKDDELSQTLQFDRLNKPLTAAVQVRTRLGQCIGSQPAFLELRRKLLREFRVAIVHHDVGLVFPANGFIHEQLCLLFHPSRIGMQRRFRGNHLACRHTKPNQHVHVPEPRRCDGLDREEVHGPKRLRVPLDEVIPTIALTLWPGFNPFFLQDVSHRLPADLLDAQLPQLADDAGVAKARGLCNLDYQFADFLGLALTTFGILNFPFATVFIPDPPIKCRRRHNRDQFLNGSADHFAQLQKPRSFLGLGVNLSGNPRPQDFVFLFEIFDIFCQLIVGGRSDHREEGVENLRSHGIVVSCNVGRDCTSVVQRYVPVSMPKNGVRNRLFRIVFGRPLQSEKSPQNRVRMALLKAGFRAVWRLVVGSDWRESR